jgi:hypothetical protein
LLLAFGGVEAGATATVVGALELAGELLPLPPDGDCAAVEQAPVR